MRHSLQSHIVYLENKVQSLKDRLIKRHSTSDEIQDLKAQIFHAELALEHYRQAYALELSISNPRPPDSPGMNSADGADTPKKAESEKKKPRLSAIGARRKKRAPAGLLFLFASQSDYARICVRQSQKSPVANIRADNSNLR